MGFAGAEMEFRGQRWDWTGKNVSDKDGLWEQRGTLRTEIELEWRKIWGQRRSEGPETYFGAEIGFREGRHEDPCGRTDLG